MANNVKDRRLRMLWNSNSIWTPSGYGNAQRDMLYRFLADGWPTAQSAFVGLGGSMITMAGLPIYPGLADQWGSDGMLYHGRHFGANAVFTMQDIWPINTFFLGEMTKANMAFIPYVPIDQDPVPPNVLNVLKYAYKIVTFAKFGQKALERAGFASTLIEEGVDTEIFKPMDKIQARKDLGIPLDKFVVGMIGANKDNPPRKGWQEGLEAFKLFHDNHPNSVFFWESNQNIPGGFPIQEFAKELGIGDALMRIDEYTSLVHGGAGLVMKELNAFDILIHPSTTEGFGLLPVEAQACGVPVIVNNCTSMPEHVIEGVTGEICKTARKHFSPALGYWHFADVNSLHEKMEKLFVADRKKMGEAGRKFVLDNYNIDTIVKEKWIPFFEQLQRELLPALVDKNNMNI